MGVLGEQLSLYFGSRSVQDLATLVSVHFCDHSVSSTRFGNNGGYGRRSGKPRPIGLLGSDIQLLAKDRESFRQHGLPQVSELVAVDFELPQVRRRSGGQGGDQGLHTLILDLVMCQ